MTFAIVMLYDHNRCDFGDLTSKVARQYCGAHGYRFKCYREILDTTRSPHWSKLVAMEQELGGADEWLLWLDADALIVQPRIRLQDIVSSFANSNTDLIFSTDRNGLCSGVFFLRNTAWARSFLRAAYLMGEEPGCGHLHEQKTIETLWRSFPDIRAKIEFIPDNVIQNPESMFSPTAFIMHYWAATKPFEIHQEKILRATYHGWQESCL